MEQRGDLFHKVVAACAIYLPSPRKGLAGAEDLFDHDPCIRTETLAQAAAIAERIGESVDMVDADAVDQALVVKAEVEGVGLFKDLRVFDADAGQLVDGEEAPPVEVVVGGTPERKAIVLAVQQRLKWLLSRGLLVFVAQGEMRVAINS